MTAPMDGVAFFPDAPTKRGVKHLRELAEVVRKGEQGSADVLRPEGGCWCGAAGGHIDPEYGRTLRMAAAQGVELVAYLAKVSPRGDSARLIVARRRG